MRIPEEQFSAIPVDVLSPVHDDASLCSFDSPSSQKGPISLSAISVPSGPASLCVSELSNCAGSAPNTPKTKRKDASLSTVSEQLSSLPPRITSHFPTLNKYSTLPKATGRRWSMISSTREKDRQRLEGSLLTVCANCEGMVKMVRSKNKKYSRLSDFVLYTDLSDCDCSIVLFSIFIRRRN